MSKPTTLVVKGQVYYLTGSGQKVLLHFSQMVKPPLTMKCDWRVQVLSAEPMDPEQVVVNLRDRVFHVRLLNAPNAEGYLPTSLFGYRLKLIDVPG